MRRKLIKSTCARAILSAALLVMGGSATASAPLKVRFTTPCTQQGAQPWLQGKSDIEWEKLTLPVGNGNLGAAVFGFIDTERITLNEKSLWTGGPNTERGAGYYWDVNKQAAQTVEKIREAFAEGNREEASRLTKENLNGVISYQPADEKPFRFGFYTTLGDLTIATGLNPEQATGYSRELSLSDALATVRFTDSQTATTYVRQTFCSYPANAIVMRYAVEKGSALQNLSLAYHPNPLATGQTTADGTGGLLYTARLNDNGMEFCLRIQALASGGTVSTDGEKINVSDAREVVFIITADTDYKMNFDPDFNDPKAYVGVNPLKTTEQWMQKATKLGYKKLLKEHIKDYQALYNRVTLQLGNTDEQTESSTMSTPDLLERYRREGNDKYLETLYYQFGRYLLIASSRQGNLAVNLQGVWLNTTDGPWHCDYHNNINIQMNYWPAMATALDECMPPMIEYIKSLVKPGRETARSYFGARGWTASISGNPFGFTAPLRDKDMSYNLVPVAGPWLATHLWDYYDYTRDIDWLRNEGFPIIRESADFACDMLWHKPDGTYTAAPSTSPEHGDVDEGTTFSHAVVREILIDAIEAARTLGCQATDTAEWSAVIKAIAPYKIGRYGQLMEWSQDIDDPDDHHRHVNHLFGLHPGHTISPLTTPELAQAAAVVLRHRGDGATGWSMGWKIGQWARLHDGNHAYMLYGNLLKNGTADNLWDVHPPFQIDGNFGGTSSVTEMLLQSHTGEIHLLPALPDAWPDGEIRGLKARGNYTIDISWKNGKLQKAKITANQGGTCTIRYANQTKTLTLKKGQTQTLK